MEEQRVKGCGKKFKQNIVFVDWEASELMGKRLHGMMFRTVECGIYNSIGDNDPLNQKKYFCKECCPQDVEVIIKPCHGDRPTIGSFFFFDFFLSPSMTGS